MPFSLPPCVRNVRVEAVSLRGWTAGSNGNVLTLLETLQHLRRVSPYTHALPPWFYPTCCPTLLLL